MCFWPPRQGQPATAWSKFILFRFSCDILPEGENGPDKNPLEAPCQQPPDHLPPSLIAGLPFAGFAQKPAFGSNPFPLPPSRDLAPLQLPQKFLLFFLFYLGFILDAKVSRLIRAN
ncbi:MAG: hypothetical protein CME16_07050 [Gemmatimonadetes bacterium]|nr:hypothetical protein [Gemmatimonadota bacterium]